MKRFKIWSMMMLVVMTLPMMVACGGDDDDVVPIKKSELLGTWYSLDNKLVWTFTDTYITKYELRNYTGKYYYKDEAQMSSKYSINGHQILFEDGTAVSAIIDGNILTISVDGSTIKAIKYNGTPQQLLDYLNK